MTGIQADLFDDESVQALRSQLTSDHADPSLLVNAAGVFTPKPFLEHRELASNGIRVNAVAPAVVRTPIYEGFIPKQEVDAAISGFDSFHPIGRGLLRPLPGAGIRL